MAAEEEHAGPEGAKVDDLAAELRKIKVSDLIAQAASGLVSLGFVRLTDDQRDLAQARLAIDTLRALEPVVREQVSAELANDLAAAIASLQLAFAEAAAAPKVETETESAEQPASD